jgi:membrane protease YdiL (CAAX protease family)
MHRRTFVRLLATTAAFAPTPLKLRRGLAGVLRAKAGDLALRRPPRYATRWAATGALVVLVGGLAGVVLLARPVLGQSDVRFAGAEFVVPSIVFAVSLAVAEEVAFRGALQGWLARSLGPWIAVLLAAAAYGLAWGVWLGAPFLGLVAGAAGMVLGATVVRTRTLAVALAWHAAFNVPLYVLIACRA